MTGAATAPLSRRRVLALLAGGGVLLAACGGPGGPGATRGRREEDADELRRFGQRGYEAAAASSAYPYRDTWLFGDEEVTINLLVPRGGAPAPLVVYLPGMGESADAGEAWRQAWAQAGYAVAALQTAGSAALWSSPASRNADFAPMAREQFGAKALGTRLGVLDFALHGIRRRAVAAEGVYARIDTGRIAVAGFDLGAQTALALAGEKVPGLTVPAAMPPLRAVIALSPHASLAAGGFAARFGGIELPVLAVTGTEDSDPYGLVDSPHTRQAPYRYMPAGGKYQLVLEDAGHDTIGGRPRSDSEQDMPEGREAGDRPSSPGGGRGGRGGPGGGMGGPGGGMGRPGGGGPGGMGSGRGGSGQAARGTRGSPRRQAMIVERVTLAFLDAFVKDDPVAREWLARDASRWIDPLARLEAK